MASSKGKGSQKGNAKPGNKKSKSSSPKKSGRSGNAKSSVYDRTGSGKAGNRQSAKRGKSSESRSARKDTANRKPEAPRSTPVTESQPARESATSNSHTGTSTGYKMPRFLSKENPLRQPLMVLFVLAMALYANTFSHDYALDDAIVITDNQFTQKGIAGLGDIFTTDAFTGYFGQTKDLVAGGRYRPLSIATFALEVEFFGETKKEGQAFDPQKLSPGISHFFNALLYGFLGVILFLLLVQLLPKQEERKWWFTTPFLITLLFIVHPVHTEVVANIKGRDEIMSLLFALFSLLLSLRFIDSLKGENSEASGNAGAPNWLTLFFSGFTFFLALLAKESAIPFLAIIPLTFYFFRSMQVRDYVYVVAPMAVFTLLYFLLRMQFTGGGPPAEENYELLNDPFLYASAGERYAAVSHGLLKYLGLFLVPHPLTHDYYPFQFPVEGWGLMEILGAALYLGLAAYAVLGLRKKDPIAYGIIFYLAAISIVSNAVVNIGTLMGERFLFAPSLGLCIALVLFLERAVPVIGRQFNQPKEKILQGIVGVMCLAFAFQTVARNPVWKNNFSLFTTDVENSAGSAKAQTSAGGALVEEADVVQDVGKRQEYLNRAVGHLREAVKIYPQHGNAWLLLGNAYFKQDPNNPQALVAMDSAVYHRPGLQDAYNNMGVIAARQKRFAKADYAYQQMINRRPSDSRYWYDRGLNYENWYETIGKAGYPEKPKLDSAIICFQKALELKPGYAEAQAKIGLMYGKFMNDFTKAQAAFQKAIQMGGRDEWIFDNLGISYAMQGNPQEAVKRFKEGLNVNPNSAKLNLNLAITLQNMGDSAQAKGYFDRAFQLDPSLRR